MIVWPLCIQQLLCRSKRLLVSILLRPPLDHSHTPAKRVCKTLLGKIVCISSERRSFRIRQLEITVQLMEIILLVPKMEMRRRTPTIQEQQYKRRAHSLNGWLGTERQQQQLCESFRSSSPLAGWQTINRVIRDFRARFQMSNCYANAALEFYHSNI